MTNDTLDFTSEQFKELYNKLEGEPEFRIYFSNHSDEYMVIKYDAKVSFQRCGVSDGSGEIYFDSLDCLFIANTIDDICLKRDWESVTDIILDDWYHLSDKNDIDKLYSDQKRKWNDKYISIQINSVMKCPFVNSKKQQKSKAGFVNPKSI